MARTKYYHADEAANLLGITIDEVRTMLIRKELKGHKQGRRWLVDMDQPCLQEKNQLILKEQGTEELPSAAPLVQYIKDSEHEEFMTNQIKQVKKSLYIATANFKNVHIKDETLISILNKLVRKGVTVQVICSRLQSSEEADFELIECPRNHMKLFIFDEQTLYIGSANLTPAALEDRSNKKTRTNNHEAGIITTDKAIIKQAIEHFKAATTNEDCKTCKIQICGCRTT